MFEQSHVGSYVDRDGTHLATRLLNIWEPSCDLVFMLQVGGIKFHFVTFGQVIMGELNASILPLNISRCLSFYSIFATQISTKQASSDPFLYFK